MSRTSSDSARNIVDRGSRGALNSRAASSVVQPQPAAPHWDGATGERERLHAELEACRKECSALVDRCERAELESRQAREEIDGLGREIEELQDNFKEEESEQFEQLKQQLELANKNCKILQIRLSKAERQYGQLEQVKSALELQLSQWTLGNKERPTSAQATGGSPATGHPTQASSASIQEASSERERDLQEQMRYAQEEAQLKGEKLAALEQENELLTAKIGRLTAVNSHLRARAQTGAKSLPAGNGSPEAAGVNLESLEKTLAQNEQLSLALELSQAEIARLKGKCSDLTKLDETLRECEARRAKLEQDLDKASGRESAAGEIRQLRSRLAASELECRQLRARQPETAAGPRAQAAAGCPECGRLLERNKELERRLTEEPAAHQLERNLLQRLRGQLEATESEMKRRLAEAEAESGRVKREHKRLLETLEASGSRIKRCQPPPAAVRESWGRKELREFQAELESENGELATALQAKECLLAELGRQLRAQSGGDASTSGTPEELRGARELVERERALNAGLKAELAELTRLRGQLEVNESRLKRELAALEEELEKLRALNGELQSAARGLEARHLSDANKLKSLEATIEQLEASLKQEAANQRLSGELPDSASAGQDSSTADPQQRQELLARDLSELRAKNSFLLRQLELSREESSRQLAELRERLAGDQSRAVELARLEERERSLAEGQRLRDELAELRGKLAAGQRAASQLEEELEAERDKVRRGERDWRRQRAQLQHRAEQAEAQLGLEKRANELRSKEAEASARERERELTSYQERNLQLEREQKRLQNKNHLLQENFESSSRGLRNELERGRRELAELAAAKRALEEENYELGKRLNSDRATLVETLESMKRSYAENLTELESCRERLAKRQEQQFKERQSHQARVEELGAQLSRLLESDFQCKSLKQQLDGSERRLEALKRELAQVRDDRHRARAKLEELERRCLKYEQDELARKTSSILRAKQAPTVDATRGGLGGATAAANNAPPPHGTQVQQQQRELAGSDGGLIEKLSGKLNDQRHLIQSLRARVEQLEGELKQAKLLKESEQSKWLSRETLLLARVNDAEERVLFEAGLAQRKVATGNSTGAAQLDQLEAAWADERRRMASNIGQLQAQLECITRDYKKASSSHELLKLQVKQLEVQNSRLSNRLITTGEHTMNQTLLYNHWQRDQLQLMAEMQQSARPLMDLVGKILEAIESPELTRTRAPDCQEPSEGSIQRSSERPLTVSRALVAPDGSKEVKEKRDMPAPKLVKEQSQMARLFVRNSGKQENLADAVAGIDSIQPNPIAKPKKLVKKVKARNPINLTASEKQQLRRFTEQFRFTLDELDSRLRSTPGPDKSRAASESVNTESFKEEDERFKIRARSASRNLGSNQGLLGGDLNNLRRASQDIYGSLTDCESESSMASELSCPDRINSSSLSSKGKRRSGGLRSRLTNTLRNISRSITSLGSDSEDSRQPKSSKDSLREIRV